MLSIIMGVENHYKQKLDELQGPRMTSDFIPLAKALFDAASGDFGYDSGLVVPPPTYFSDTAEESHAYWRLGEEGQDHEFFQVHLIGRSVLFALQHRHIDTSEGVETSGNPFVDHQKTVLVVGDQRPTISSFDGVRNQGTRNALNGWEKDLPTKTLRRKHREREILLPAFRKRLDHTMAVIGIHESAPDIHESTPELQELLLAS